VASIRQLGFKLPSPDAAREFLYQFHEEEYIEKERARYLAGQTQAQD
jgi:hypothetical protein